MIQNFGRLEIYGRLVSDLSVMEVTTFRGLQRLMGFVTLAWPIFVSKEYGFTTGFIKTIFHKPEVIRYVERWGKKGAEGLFLGRFRPSPLVPPEGKKIRPRITWRFDCYEAFRQTIIGVDDARAPDDSDLSKEQQYEYDF